MKASYIIPPLLALVLVGAWNASQMRSISSLEQDGADLRERISAALASGNGGSDSLSVKASHPGGKDSIDWKKMPAMISAVHNGGEKAQLRAMLDLQQRLKNMTREEMIAALDEIAGLDLSDEEREALIAMILEPLIKLDPQYALARFVDQIESDSSSIGWQLATAFGQWMKTDAAGATAWFDRQIAEGKFESRTLDGKSEMRAKFESEVLESLLSSDLAAAALRIQAMPEDQRREILEQLSFTELAPNEQKAYADLVRQLIPADEREGSFAYIAAQLADSGYEKVSAFLDSVQATPEERAAAAKQAATSRLEMLGSEGDISRAEVDSLRAWLDKQSPGQTDRITGKALAEAAQDGGEFDFEAASQLVIQYQQSTGSDDVLIAFLEGYSAHSNLEVAEHLAELISDPQRRAQILKKLK
ncbi:MAG: hypothetical protein V4689_14625 [Verrucomicrobiota bacterium]